MVGSKIVEELILVLYDPRIGLRHIEANARGSPTAVAHPSLMLLCLDADMGRIAGDQFSTLHL